MIDTHCHLEMPRFDADREAVLDRAWAAGVTAVILPGVWPRTWASQVAFARAHPNVHVACGIHPQVLDALAAADDAAHLAQLDAQLGQGGVVAVGECGLDGPTEKAGVPMARQLAVLEAQLDLADQHGLPVIAHCFQATLPFRALLERRGVPRRGLVLHSYSGGAELVKIFAALGCHFSLAGPVTYEKARKPLDSARAIPADRLMLETDSPDQAPTPHRGQRCEPAYVPLIAQALADARGEPVAELISRTTATARAFFGL
jgi:TatD DNase family protein